MSLRFILIGHPVGHSVSPAMHRAAYKELGLEATYQAVDCPDDSSVRQAVARLRSGEFHGANVTVPHKRLALALSDEPDELARTAGAANVLCRRGELVTAHNTDVPALAEELSLHLAGRSPAEACVFGSGGAALASVLACRELGVANITVVARSFRKPGDEGPPHATESAFASLGAKPVAWPEKGSRWFESALGGVGLLVQATTLGMLGSASGETLAELIPWEVLEAGALAYDLVYNPPVTPFVRAANQHGLTGVSGLGMLVGQAALSVKLWTGRTPSASTMARAANQVLFGGKV